MRPLFLIAFSLFSLYSSASLFIKVGLFQFNNPQVVIVAPTLGTYQVICDESLIFNLKIEDVLKFTYLANSKIRIQSIEEEIGEFTKIRLIGGNLNNKFKIKAVEPSLDVCRFKGDLYVEVADNHLQFINYVDIEDYVPKVVQSESGTVNHIEFMKSQAIICRTFAITNFRRHELEGFQLCDKIHCQVYKGGWGVNENVAAATKATQGLIIVDDKFQPINAAFHSNCGGHTLNGEDVWSARSYLKGIRDTYCKTGAHATWEQEIPKKDLINYFSEIFSTYMNESNLYTYTFNTISDERKPSYFYNNKKVLVKDVRNYWGLKSAKFKIEQSYNDSDNFMLKGQGFGHRVGLCQEGAMSRALHGISYNKILSSYYHGISIVYYSDLGFK